MLRSCLDCWDTCCSKNITCCMYNLTQVLNSIQRGFIFIKWKQSEVVEVLNLLRGGILFLIENKWVVQIFIWCYQWFHGVNQSSDILKMTKLYSLVNFYKIIKLNGWRIFMCPPVNQSLSFWCSRWTCPAAEYIVVHYQAVSRHPTTAFRNA